MSLETILLKTLKRADYSPSDFHALRKKLNLKAHQTRELSHLLERLEKQGQIVKIRNNAFALAKEADLVTGRLRFNKNGAATLIPLEPLPLPIHIPFENTATALHNDLVVVRLESHPIHRRGVCHKTGVVIKILERSRTELVGTLKKSQQFYYVVPDDARFPHDVYVKPSLPTAPQSIISLGSKVLVKLLEWTDRQRNPEGTIIEILGKPEEPGVDMLSILKHYNLSSDFPDEVLEECRNLSKNLDLKNRRDCRSHLVITIDPDDAKDFDDAISLAPASEDQWKLWVHIADVSHYVSPGSHLDREARKRGNSTYLVDRVIPMLPPILSNDLCSLKPHVDRLTACAEFLISSKGKVIKTQFYRAIIHSKHRYTYQEAFKVLQRQPKNSTERMLHQIHHLAQKFRRQRFSSGSLDLDFPESKIRLNTQGEVVGVERVENDVSHQLIEECMLLANEAVAKYLKTKKRPSLYRIHETPDPEKLQEFREMVCAYHIPCGDLTSRREIQKLLQHLKKDSLGQALKIGLLRSLKRACYSPQPLGHYGLAKIHYTHFTSPIRRYADLIVHRSLFDNAKKFLGQGALKEVSEHISLTERNSAEAEQDSKTTKMLQFLQQQITSNKRVPYEALITDVQNFGFFVDVHNLCLSGLVPVSSMKKDFYLFDASRFQLRGKRTRHLITIGDKVKVQVLNVDFYKKRVDFSLATN
ncbi:MAG: ribonuclease R [Verrucomicrobiia bacterium]